MRAASFVGVWTIVKQASAQNVDLQSTPCGKLVHKVPARCPRGPLCRFASTPSLRSPLAMRSEGWCPADLSKDYAHLPPAHSKFSRIGGHHLAAMVAWPRSVVTSPGSRGGVPTYGALVTGRSERPGGPSSRVVLCQGRS
jgi:hypothetical protein